MLMTLTMKSDAIHSETLIKFDGYREGSSKVSCFRLKFEEQHSKTKLMDWGASDACR